MLRRLACTSARWHVKPTVRYFSLSKRMFEKKAEEQQQQDPDKPNKDDQFSYFLSQLSEFQEAMGQKIPLQFGTSYENYDMANMYPFAKLQMNLFKSVYDKQFNEDEFLEGAKNAFTIVRPLLVQRDVEAMQSMLTQECHNSVKEYFDNLAKVSDELHIKLQGHVEQIKSASIKNIRIREMDGRMDTIVNVQFVVNEAFAIVNEKAESLLLGHRDVRERTSIWSFTREGSDGPWKLRAFVK